MSTYSTTPILGSVDNLTWLTGNWHGQRGEDVIDEHWSAPAAGMLMGMFRWLRGGEVWFYELIAVETEGEGLVFRIKHFYPGMKGWEEKDESVTFDLVSLGDGEAAFFKRGGKEPKWMVYRRVDEGTLVSWFEGEEGTHKEKDEFRYVHWGTAHYEKTEVASLIEVLKKERNFFSYEGRRASEILTEIGEPAVAPLIELLSHRNSDVRSLAAYTLGRIGSRTAVEPLIGLLGDRQVLLQTANALGDIGDPKACEPLLDALIREEKMTRGPNAEQAGRVSTPARLALAPILLGEGSTAVFHSILLTLVKLGHEPTTRALAEAAIGDDKRLGSPAVWMLAQLQTPIPRDHGFIVDALLHALKDPDYYVRAGAAAALGRLADRRAVAALLNALKDADGDVRWHAAFALGTLGDERALPELTRVAEYDEGATEDGELVREAAREAIERITKKYQGLHASLTELDRDISLHWPKGVSATDAVNDERFQDAEEA
jgi:HEAT repeat protein